MGATQGKEHTQDKLEADRSSQHRKLSNRRIRARQGVETGGSLGTSQLVADGSRRAGRSRSSWDSGGKQLVERWSVSLYKLVKNI